MLSCRVVAALSISALLGASPAYAQTKAAGDSSIRRFTVHVPQAALNDLRRRLAATRWPDKETVADRSQGAGFAKWTYGNDPQQSPTKDDVLDDFTLYWLTNTAASAARLYWENKGKGPTSSAAHKTTEISVPVAVTVFPDEVYPHRRPGSGGRTRS